MLCSNHKKHLIVVIPCLLVFVVCAWIQYNWFSNAHMWGGWTRWIPHKDYRYFATLEESEQRRAEIEQEYGKELVGIWIDYNFDNPGLYNVSYTTDRWVTGDYSVGSTGAPPQLSDILSQNNHIHLPLIISIVIMLPSIIISQIERDYKPNKNILTLLRLPRARSRYLLSKLIDPVILIFLFWAIQFVVVLMQAGHYFDRVPEEAIARMGAQSPWTFDYYRILYPVIEPIWFPAVAGALVMVPLVIVTIIFAVKGGMKSWIYAVLPVIGTIAVVFTATRVSQFWWITPVLLVAVYLNCTRLVNKGQIVQ